MKTVRLLALALVTLSLSATLLAGCGNKTEEKKPETKETSELRKEKSGD